MLSCISFACCLLFSISNAKTHSQENQTQENQNVTWACDTKHTCFYDVGVNGYNGICFEVREGDERLDDTSRYIIVGDHCDDTNCDSKCKPE